MLAKKILGVEISTQTPGTGRAAAAVAACSSIAAITMPIYSSESNLIVSVAMPYIYIFAANNVSYGRKVSLCSSEKLKLLILASSFCPDIRYTKVLVAVAAVVAAISTLLFSIVLL